MTTVVLENQELNPGEQISVDELIWEILEGDPREDVSDRDASIGKTLKGGSPRAIKDDARICFILDCCRCPTSVCSVKSSLPLPLPIFNQPDAKVLV